MKSAQRGNESYTSVLAQVMADGSYEALEYISRSAGLNRSSSASTFR